MPALEPGATVRVKRLSAPGHMRTPAYLRGATGTVERVLGPFANPEQLAYRHPADRLPLYRIRFRMADVWPEAEAPDDTVDAEIYAHWLETP